MNLTQLKKACMEEIERAYSIVEARYNIKLPRVPVEWSRRMTKVGGYAIFTKDGRPTSIKLSTTIALMNPDVFIKDVPAHEAIHLACLVIHGLRSQTSNGGHGYQWQQMMKLVGRSTSATHSMKTIDTRVTAYCNCNRPLKISKICANKIRRKQASYNCRVCRSSVRLFPTQPAPTRMVVTPINKDARTASGIPSATITQPAPAVKPHPVVSDKRGSDAICAMLVVFKKRGMDLTTVLDNAKVVSAMAAQAHVTSSDALAMIKHNWNRV